MRQAAAAAHMSVGGIYHYFPSKRDLVLFVLSPEALQRLCHSRTSCYHRRSGPAHTLTWPPSWRA